MAVHPAQVLLSTVPRVGHYTGGPRPPELTQLPSCLTGILEYLGERCEVPASPGHAWHNVYIHLMACSGATWRIQWPREGWDPVGAPYLKTIEDAGEMVARLFGLAGYGYEFLLRTEYAEPLGYDGEVCDDDEVYVERLVTAIADQAKPVIGLGPVHSPAPCLLCGYEDGGRTVLGWSEFQEDHQTPPLEKAPTGHFRDPGWLARTQGLLVLGEPTPRRPLSERYRLALMRGRDVILTPAVRGNASGLAAYDAWIECFGNAALFPKDDTEAMLQRHGCYMVTSLTVAEGRAWAARFCRDVAAAHPSLTEPLLDAAACYDGIHDLMWACWEFTGGNDFGEANARKLAEPYRRSRIINLLKIAKKLELDAVRLLATALEQWPE